MKRIILTIFATISIGVNALFDDDLSYTSDGTTLVCLNIESTNIDRHVDIKYQDLWGVSTIERLIVHLNDSEVLISNYTPNKEDGGYRSFLGGVFNIVNKSNNVPYIEFKMKDGPINGRLNRFTGDIHLGNIYGPCKKIERLL